MQFYVVSKDGRAWLCAEQAGRLVNLQLAYREALLAGGACAGPAAAARLAETLLPADLRAFIEMGEEGRRACRQALDFAASPGAHPALQFERDSVRIEPPLRTPGKFICIGLNYRAHARESNAAIPSEPVFFNKFATSITGPYDPIVHQGPKVTAQLDYEVELAVVIGKRAKNVARAQALEHVFGYTICNDVSARDLQHRDGQWVKGKALDTYAPIGPCVVTREAIDGGNLDLRLAVNQEVRQQSNTSDLIFSIPELIEYLSHLLTLEPGDVISTGTPSGVGGAAKPPRFLQVGDTVRAEIEGIGFIENRIVAHQAGDI